MRLFYAPGACSLSPHIVLRELGLPFTLDAVDLKTKTTQSGEDFKAVNPKGYVPALQLDDGEILTEGVAIIQYLADNYASGTLTPVGCTVERARLNGHLNFISAELHKAFGPLFNPTLAPAARDAMVANIQGKLGLIDQALADGRPFLTGSDFTVADAYLFVILGLGPMLGLDFEAWPRLGEFSRRVAARPAVQSALAAEKQQEPA